jgi:hypothetical protein
MIPQSNTVESIKRRARRRGAVPPAIERRTRNEQVSASSPLVGSRRPVRQEVPAIGSTPRSRSHAGLAAILMILFVRYRASVSFRVSSAIGELLESHNWIGYLDPGLGWFLV